mmetsp:Transcript_46583/g.131137  ORF Transcript_46583/g.131137 Transcript_46583/m.131137 type:complete len:89 (+) Transcript_46583:740-1006(+)
MGLAAVSELSASPGTRFGLSAHWQRDSFGHPALERRSDCWSALGIAAIVVVGVALLVRATCSVQAWSDRPSLTFAMPLRLGFPGSALC